MSLLLEALKRAEKAKEEARRRADEAAPSAESRRVLTRDHLPDISHPLEVLRDDVGQPARSPEYEPGAAPRPASTGTSQHTGDPKPGQAQPLQRERATARMVFEAKFREPNPRRPFFIALGALGICAAGIVVYFWYQLRPPAPLAIANPVPPVGERMRALAETAAPATTPDAPMRPIRGMPTGGRAAAEKARAAPPPAARPRPSTPAVPPTLKRQAVAAASPGGRRAPRTESAAVAAVESSTVIASRSAPDAEIHPQVETGYAAYQAGDLARAKDAYRKALADDPGNRDALLGLAAVETRLRNPAAAQELYGRVLDRDPRDIYARAGLLGLRGAQQDPVLAESQLKSLLAADPQATELQLALGNQYARQERWADAQQAYFKAFAAEPDNPDCAYNLAISLDHLHQSRLALEYYRQALALSGTRRAGFDRTAVEKRVQELAR